MIEHKLTVLSRRIQQNCTHDGRIDVVSMDCRGWFYGNDLQTTLRAVGVSPVVLTEGGKGFMQMNFGKSKRDE